MPEPGVNRLLMRFVLAPLRAVMFVLHVLAGLATVLIVFPLAGLATRNRINRAWSRIFVAICGARLIVDGEPIPPHITPTGLEPWSLGRLVLANHVSWIDVFAINAATPCPPSSPRRRSAAGRCSGRWCRGRARSTSSAGGGTRWRR